MTNSNELLKLLLKRAGISDEKIKAGIESGEWDKESTELAGKLMNKEAAILSDDVRKAVMAKTFSGIENTLINHIRDNYAKVLPDGAMASILAPEKFSEKAIAAIKAISGAKDEKIEALKKDSGVSQEMREQIANAANMLKGKDTEISDLKKQLETQKGQYEEQITRSHFASWLSGKKLVGENETLQQISREHILNSALKKARIKIGENGEKQLINSVTGDILLNPETQQPETVESYLLPIGADLYAKAEPRSEASGTVGQPGVYSEEDIKSLDPIALKALQRNRENVQNLTKK